MEELIEPRFLKRLKVGELRDLLAERGLSTDGNKDALVARLEATRGGGDGDDDAKREDAPAAAEEDARAPEAEAEAGAAAEADAAAEEEDADAEDAPATDPDAGADARDDDDDDDDDDADADADASDPAPATDDADPPAPTVADAADPPSAEETDAAGPGAAPAEETDAEPAPPPPRAPPKTITSAKLDRARGKLRANPHDLDAWEIVIAEAQTHGVPDGRSLFEEVLASHPTASRVWRTYAEAEIAGDASTGARDDEHIKALFSRCLLVCPSAALWRSYTKYMRKANDASTAVGAQAIKAAYEYTVERVGEDIEAGPLWLDYVSFLKVADAAHLAPEHADVDAHAQSAKTQQLRRAYQRALSVPTNSIDALYREYDAFEHANSPTLAKMTLADVKPRVDVARGVLKQRKKLHDPILVGGLAGAPGSVPDNTTDRKSPSFQARRWRDLVAFEKTNAQGLEPDAASGETAHPQLIARVSLTYDQATMSLMRYPDVWLEYAAWHQSEGRADDAVAVLARARDAVPACAVVRFAAADLEESRGNVEAAREVYEEFMDEHEANTAQAAISAGAGTSVGPEDGASIVPPRREPMDDDAMLTYIEHMRCARRMEGTQAARKAFMRGRKAPGSRWEIFAAAAWLEWRYDKNDKPARNIFELGLKNFIDVPAFVNQYAEFLIGCNDVANARVLFERATASASTAAADAGPVKLSPQEKARRMSVVKDVHDMFVAFEQTHGTMASMTDAERRREEALGFRDNREEAHAAAATITALMGRHSFLSLQPATAEEKKHYAKIGASIPKRFDAFSSGIGRLPPPPPPPKPGVPPPPPPGKPRSMAAQPNAIAPLPAPPVAVGPPDDRFEHLPTELAAFASRLPAPDTVKGGSRRVMASTVTAVMDTLMTSDLTPDGGAAIVEALNASRGVREGGRGKRKADDDGGGGGGGGGTGPLTMKTNAPPVGDVFRARQAKHARTNEAEFQ